MTPHHVTAASDGAKMAGEKATHFESKKWIY